MKELISIINQEFSGNQANAVDARQLHEFLESKKQFTDWIGNKVLNDEFLEEGNDYIVLPQTVKNPNGGRPRKDYALTMETAKHVSMIERTEAGRKARAYFIECEKVAKGIIQPALETSRKEELELELLVVQTTADMLRLSDSAKLNMMHILCDHNKIPSLALPEYTENVRAVCSATHLLEKNNCILKIRAFNKLLLEAGILEKKKRLAAKGKKKAYNSITEKGLKYGQNDAYKGSSTETQPHYYEDTFMELHGLVCGS